MEEVGLKLQDMKAAFEAKAHEVYATVRTALLHLLSKDVSRNVSFLKLSLIMGI